MRKLKFHEPGPWRKNRQEGKLGSFLRRDSVTPRRGGRHQDSATYTTAAELLRQSGRRGKRRARSCRLLERLCLVLECRSFVPWNYQQPIERFALIHQCVCFPYNFCFLQSFNFACYKVKALLAVYWHATCSHYDTNVLSCSLLASGNDGG